MATAAMARTLTETVPPEPTLQMRLQIPGLQPKAASVANSKLRNRLRLDPTRALEPARKKIATIEAQRIMSVFEDTIMKSEIVTLTPYIIENLDRFRVNMGGDLSDLMEHHAVILGSYEEIKQTLDKQMSRTSRKSKGKGRKSKSPTMSDDGNQMLDELQPAAMAQSPSQQSGSASRQSSFRPESGGSGSGSFSRPNSSSSNGSNFSMDSQIERTVRSLTMVAQQLNTSCKNVLRAFQSNPSALNAIKQAYAKRGASAKSFIQYLNELKDILMNKLLTTPEEEKERMDYLQEISKRERNNASIIEKLEAELKIAQDDKDEEIKKKNDVIRGLQADLRQIQKFSEDHIRRVNSEADKQKGADKKNSEGRKQRLTQEVTQLQTEKQNLVTEHRENEQELRKKKFKIETEVENWIQRYDADMGERQDEFEEIDEVYTQEKTQLHELEERFKTLEAEYNTIMEERRLARERREAAERELALMIKASTTIQAFWRSFKVRKALKSRKKKGGKKKK
ncbi:dynein regulatory complex protein 10-like [Mya arenaria]|uniref:dynein regulatory complex protein 10-like n=1 Tax=Mya arenaria TaxID=6604 RepID=UPI0022E16795|nr:dynein regulatory complex protein 10-like [Mya arenaria]